MPTENQVGQRASGLWKIAGAIPVGSFLLLMALLIGHDSRVALRSPILLAALNTLIHGPILLAVVLMATRSCRTTGSLLFLMMGCGALIRGFSALMAAWVMPSSGNPNSIVALHDVCSLLAGIFHLASAHFLLADLAGTRPPETRLRHLGILYSGIMALVCVIAALAVWGMLPAFFVPGVGPTLLRQFVLGGAMCTFAVSGLVFVSVYSATKTEFAYWYGLALLLIAAGLVFVLSLKTAGGTLGWVGRSAQSLGSIYFIFALLAGRRETEEARVSSTATTRWGLWPYLEQKVNERTLALEKANEDLRKEIARRKLTEQTLQESEERYRQLFEAESDAIFLVDWETERLIDANPAALKLYGYSRQEFRWLKAPDLSAEPERTSNAIAERQPFTSLHRHRKKDGAVFPVEITRNFFRLHGRDVHVAAIRDITERKRAEERISCLAAIVESTDDAVIGKTLDGTVQSWNRGSERVYGYTAGEIIGRPVSVLVPASGREELERIMARLKAGQAVEQFETTRLHKDGHLIPVALTMSPIKDASGRIVGASAIARDISWRKRAEEDLRRSDTKFRTLYDSTRDAVMLLGENGFFDCNPATLAIFGCTTREEFCSRHPADLSPPMQPDGTDSRTLSNQHIAIAMEEGGHHFEWVHKRADTGESFAADVLLNAMKLDGKRVLCATVRDITERKRAEKRMQMFSQEILAAREGERKQVSSVLHHDVGSLAVGLSAYFDAIEEDLRSGKTGQSLKWLERTRDLFDKSMIRLKALAVELRPPELDILGLRAALSRYFSQISEHRGIQIQLRETLGTEPVPAHAATILFRVAQEALTNAIKNGGAKRADVDIRTSNGRVSLTIRDNGSGFDVSQQMALAESKIGLRAMKDMATSMGGDFSVESEPGKGTTVRVILPMESADLESNGSAVRGETTAQSPAILTAAQRAQPEKGGGA